MANNADVPATREEANGPAGSRDLVIIGGLLSAFVLLPTLPYVWVFVGAILVPVVWVKTGKTRKAMMAAAGCSTQEEWNTCVSNLPKKKQLQQGTTPSVLARPGGALAAVAHAEGRPPQTSSLSAKRAQKSFSSSPRPELRLPQYRVLSSVFANYEVVGGFFREQSVIAALGGLVPNVEKTVEDAVSYLIPEPENPHGYGNAVMVWINGHHVGYLANEDARRYRPVLDKIVSAGYLPTTTGRIWGVTRHDWEGKPKHHLYARIALNEPGVLLPTNNPPASPYSLLPWGPAIQVTKEADHLAELTEPLCGPDSYAIAVLKRPHARSRTVRFVNT